MSFIRNANGTGWYGSITLNKATARRTNLKFDSEENIMSEIENFYQIYGVCPALYIPERFSEEKFENVYKFLYGHSLEELMTEKNSTAVLNKEFLFEPEEWTTQTVMSMDWGMFCFTYYIFLSSDKEFYTRVWNVLEFIFKTLKDSPEILISLLSSNNKKSDQESCIDFWETVYKGLHIKIMDTLNENNCYMMFREIKDLYSFFPEEKYTKLKSDCSTFLKAVARSRIDRARLKTYSVKEIVNFDIETLFFYEEFFNSTFCDVSTRQYVLSNTFNFLFGAGDEIVRMGEYLGADEAYQNALKYAQSEIDTDLISKKRKEIKKLVASDKRKRKRIYNKERWNNYGTETITTIAVNISMAIFLISIVAVALFGIFMIFGVFKEISKTVFFISLCIVALFVLLLNIPDKKN